MEKARAGPEPRSSRIIMGQDGSYFADLARVVASRGTWVEVDGDQERAGESDHRPLMVDVAMEDLR